MPRPLPLLPLLALLSLVAFASAGYASFIRPKSLPQWDLLKKTKLRIYGSSLDDYGAYLLETEANEVLRDPRYEPGKPLAFYFHGYTENADKESARTIISAFIKQRSYNFVFVDWSRLANEFYLIPMLLVPEVGRALARRLDVWHEAGAHSIDDVYLVGHSLGGQAAGFTGKALTKGKLPRITALDPALPGFSNKPILSSHIAPSDATFVDVIHTDGGNYGVDYPTGHVDYYPNGGTRLQPGCLPNARLLSDEDFCSHWRSWRFFAESLDPSMPLYLAVACASKEDFVEGRCANNERSVMGYATPPSTRGTFYMETSAVAPFGRAEAGLTASTPGENATTTASP